MWTTPSARRVPLRCAVRRCTAGLLVLLMAGCAPLPAPSTAPAPEADPVAAPVAAAAAAVPAAPPPPYVDVVQCDARVDADLLFGRGHELFQERMPASLAKASTCLTLAATKGDDQALCYLAALHSDRRGIDPDPVKAVRYLRQGALTDNACAEFGLANAYITGAGVSRNTRQAQTWMLRSAQHGYAAAQYMLGTQAEARKDPITAWAWLAIATEYGHPQAGVRQQAVDGRLTARQRTQAQARAQQLRATLMPVADARLARTRREVLEFVGYVDRFFPELYAGMGERQRYARTASWVARAATQGIVAEADVAAYITIIGFLDEDAVRGNGRYPEIDRILANAGMPMSDRLKLAAERAQALQGTGR
ncbi:hypothetical protein GCM10007242_49230 [Pigmentiphaga litoralis]|jgi:TPR repeat protein|uniref:tetratricopeptide repeat protein n=1 Tax=Pigmentiphaga litoralis TaxID=516702 RepID=UPI0016759548|nr:tetratricopeptide repeat protein [Pigmentiphaga litoralis]GGX36117.1 hypothetical protein GCM10007242_49230 [Pigmentiphaga litoralis]